MRSIRISISVVSLHGVHVSFGAFTTLELEDLNVEIWGAEGLAKLFTEEVKTVRTAFEDQDRKTDLPKSLVAPLLKIGLQIAFEYFVKNPEEFMQWLESIKNDSFEDGKREKIREIKDVFEIR